MQNSTVCAELYWPALDYEIWNHEYDFSWVDIVD